MTSDDLVEKAMDVAGSIRMEGASGTDYARGLISAVVNVVLEEAARVAEGPPYRTSATTGEVAIRGTDDGNWSVPMPLSGYKGSDYGTGRYDAAAAIRAMKKD